MRLLNNANIMYRTASVLLLSFVLLASETEALASDSDIYELKLEAPITRWDEAIPLGNGMLGGLLWGSGNTINLSLDRGDLWDETLAPEILEGNWNYANMKKLIKDNWGEYVRRYDNIYNHPAPTKLPGGRLVLTLSEDKKASDFTLDMKNALGVVNFKDNSKLECFFHASQRVSLIIIDDNNVACKFIRPDGIDRLKYKPATFGQADGMNWMVQEASEGLVYATLTVTKHIGDKTLIAVTITTNKEDANETDPLALAKKLVLKALDTGYDEMFATHEQWWDNFWSISEVTIPDERIQRHYNLVKYFYGAASRPDAPSMPLQAVWTQDSGGLPPWKGDFHHDLNTQMTYLAYHKAGLTDAGLSFINHMWNLLPEYRKFARDFYGVNGAVIPAVMTLNGKPLGGWPQYTLSPTFSIWVGQSFYLHWKHTMDEKFLRERAYPWMNEIMIAITELLEEKDGKLYLPLSSSSEIFNNSKRAFLKPNSNQDLAMLHWAYDAMAEMAQMLDKSDDAGKWRALRVKLNPLHVDKDNVLMFSSDEPFNQSHRHHAHVMAIHPFATLNIDGSARDRKIIKASVAKMDELGSRAWTGYSFSWFSSILARVGQPELAWQYLIYYERAFTLRNGFHVNGDQIGTGLSGFSYRPFTLEGNFLAMEAVHDMILQSWPVDIAKDPNPVIRVFPAMPWAWHNASFRGICAEGGFVVSARYENNATTWFEIKATVDSELRLRDNFDGAQPKFNLVVKKVGSDFVVSLKAGQSLIGTLARARTIPPQPAESIEVEKRIQRVEDIASAKKYKITSTNIPLRIGADNNGQNCFVGDIARFSIFNRVLSAKEIADLAARKDAKGIEDMPDCIISDDFVDLSKHKYDITGKVVQVERSMHFDGKSFLSIAHDESLNCNQAITLEAWIHPETTGTRVIDKSIAGSSQGYLIDTYGGGLRMISNADTSNPTSKQKIPLKVWTHIAATVDGHTGQTTLYINGTKVNAQ
ncbi:MAG: glycoside hydrolase N-terminal domain-containing protein [Phycisphaerae bacterium]|nr:glycoside hydrolase N-terminal domain-containing protein [Phycisphaerae bacterium]